MNRIKNTFSGCITESVAFTQWSNKTSFFFVSCTNKTKHDRRIQFYKNCNFKIKSIYFHYVFYFKTRIKSVYEEPRIIRGSNRVVSHCEQQSPDHEFEHKTDYLR